MKIIQLGHQSQVGKDTFADMIIPRLMDLGLKVERVTYADKIKDIYCETYEVTRSDLEFSKVNDEGVREELEHIGRRMRAEDSFIFVNSVIEKITKWKKEGVDVVFVTDLRYDNEWFEKAIHVKVEKQDHKPRPLDGFLMKAKWDYIIDNNYSREFLRCQAHTMAQRIVEDAI